MAPVNASILREWNFRFEEMLEQARQIHRALTLAEDLGAAVVEAVSVSGTETPLREAATSDADVDMELDEVKAAGGAAMPDTEQPRALAASGPCVSSMVKQGRSLATEGPLELQENETVETIASTEEPILDRIASLGIPGSLKRRRSGFEHLDSGTEPASKEMIMDAFDGLLHDLGSRLGEPSWIEPLDSCDPIVGHPVASRLPEVQQAEPLIAGDRLSVAHNRSCSENDASEPAPPAKRPQLNPQHQAAPSTAPVKPKRTYTPICRHPGCSVTASFGPDGTGCRHFCQSHKPLLFVRIGLKCNSRGCKKVAYFRSDPGDQRYCASHKPDDAEPIRGLACQAASCSSRPLGHFPGLPARYCKGHMIDGMVVSVGFRRKPVSWVMVD